MAITGIHNITNVTGNSVLFVNTENSGNNRVIPAGSTHDVGNAWVPWVFGESSFPGHHFEIINEQDNHVIWYIWQHTGADGDYIRASQTGWSEPGPQIGGSAHSGEDRNFWLSADGLRADQP